MRAAGGPIKRFPGEADERDTGIGDEMLLRVLLAVLLGYLLSRLLRRTGPGGPSGAHVPPRRGLDPERAVRASWSEVKGDSSREDPGGH